VEDSGREQAEAEELLQARAEYWALHAELGLPPEEGSNAMNLGVWARILSADNSMPIVSNAELITAVGWRKLSSALQRMKATLEERTEELGLVPMRLPALWRAYREERLGKGTRREASGA